MNDKINMFVKLNLLQLCKDFVSRQDCEYTKVSPVFYELVEMIGEITHRSSASFSVAESLISTAAIKSIVRDGQISEQYGGQGFSP